MLELNNSDTNRTYVVTGGAGFLGSHLVERLLQEGNKVICFDNEFRGSFKNLNSCRSKNLVLHRGDIRNLNEWPINFDRIYGIYHLAAINGTHNFYEIPETVLDVNVKGVINALEFVRKNDIEYFSFASTPEAYGIPQTFPTSETEILAVPNIINPRWSYGASKIIGEVYCSALSNKYGFKCSIVRFHNTYGPRDHSGHVIPDLIHKLLKNQKFVVEGNGNETRSFSFVSDSIDATLLIEKKQTLKLDVFNVGIDKETTILDLIQLIEKVSNKKIRPILKEKINAGTTRRIPDISKIRNLGFTPKISLEKGLKITFDWLLENK